MAFSKEVEFFIKTYVKELETGTAAIFCGAGMSKAVGFVDWPELLREIAEELGLDVTKEQHDLISVAQYHVNRKMNSDDLARKILHEFSEKAEPSSSHEILARLQTGT